MAEFHAPKSIKKSELYDFTWALHEKRVEQLKKEYQPKLQNKIDYILRELNSTLLQADRIIQTLSDFDEIEFVGQLTNGSYGMNRLKDARSHLTTSATHLTKNSLIAKAQSFQTIRWEERHYAEKNPILKQYIVEWNKICTEYDTKKSESYKLRQELDALVKAEKKAAKSYIKLAQLGLDMTAFVPTVAEVSKNLPSIVAPTVDISIFNIPIKKES